MSRGVNLLLVGSLVVLLFFGLLLQALPSPAAASGPSATSAEPDGRRATFLLLQELGFDVHIWGAAPGDLPGEPALLILPEVPAKPPAYDELERPEGARISARRRRDPRHYERFMDEGGTILAIGDEDMLAFLVDELELVALEDLEILEVDPTDRVQVTLRGGENLALGWRPTTRFLEPPVFSSSEVLVSDDAGDALVVRQEVGSGAICLVADGRDFLSNRRIDDRGNALFFVRLIEDLAADRRVFFDEYALGGWVPDSPLQLAFAPENLTLSVHFVLWSLIALWGVAWVRRFPRDPEPLARISAMGRAQSAAGLFVRSGRWDLLASTLRAGVLRRLARRSGVRSSHWGDSEPDAEAVRRILGAVLRHVDEARVSELSRLFSTPVEGPLEFEQLGRDLLELERHVSAGPS